MMARTMHDWIVSPMEDPVRPVSRAETRSVAGRDAQQFWIADDLQRGDDPAIDAAYFVAKADRLRADALRQAAPGGFAMDRRQARCLGSARGGRNRPESTGF